MNNDKKSDSLKRRIEETGSKLSDKLAKESGYTGEACGKKLAKDLCKAKAISKETKEAVIEGINKRNAHAHPYGKQKTDVNKNIDDSDVSDFSNAVDEIMEVTNNVVIKF